MSVDPSFWQPFPHPPIPLFEQLSDEVLVRSEKRCPKWKFKISDALIVQVQPKPVQHLTPFAVACGRTQLRLAFEGIAIAGADIRAAEFKCRAPGLNRSRLGFRLFATAGEDRWWFKVTSAALPRGISDFDAWRDQVRHALVPERFARLTPDMMLCPCCLLCGKPLVDPASIARWVGPECAQSNSLIVPRIVSLITGDSGELSIPLLRAVEAGR